MSCCPNIEDINSLTDGSVRNTYQSEATNSFSNLPLLSTVATVRSIIAAAAQPAYGRVGDVFGRVELLTVGVFFYVIGELLVNCMIAVEIETLKPGTILEAAADNVGEFSGGAVSDVTVYCSIQY